MIVTRGHLVKAVRLWYLHVYIYIHLLVTFFLNQGIMQHNYYYFEEKKWLKSEIAKRGWKWKKVDENFRFFFRLHQVSSHPQSILGLCALFENIIQKVISFSGQNSKDVLLSLTFECIWLWRIILSTNQISGSTFSLATFNQPGLYSGIFSGCLYILFSFYCLYLLYMYLNLFDWLFSI